MATGSFPFDVSVVVPTKDRWSKVGRTLRGVLAQEGVTVELIVVDDGSATPAPADLPELKEPGVQLLRHEQSRNVAAARNTGVGQARGEWIAFLDDDDLWSPDKLRLQVDAARRADATFVYGAMAIVDDDLDLIDIYPAPEPDSIHLNLLLGNAIPAGASNLVARADVVRELGGFDEELHQLTGWDLWIRLAHSGRAAACPEVVGAYVQHRGAMLINEQRKALAREYNYLASKHRPLAEELGVESFDRGGFAAWMAWGDTRAGNRLRAAAGFLKAARIYRGDVRRWMLRRVVHSLRGQLITDSGRPPADPADRPDWLDRYAAPSAG